MFFSFQQSMKFSLLPARRLFEKRKGRHQQDAEFPQSYMPGSTFPPRLSPYGKGFFLNRVLRAEDRKEPQIVKYNL